MLSQAQFARGNFRNFAEAAKRVKNIKIQWKNKQEVVCGDKLNAKQSANMKIEGRLMKQLKTLKSTGGPFTDSSSVDKFLQDSTVPMKTKKQRMMTE